jgi:hypothetical protein
MGIFKMDWLFLERRCGIMAFGVILDMRNSSALVTVAMLSTYLSEEHRDYLELLLPFVLTLLPKEKDEQINKDNILDELNCRYGFTDFPLHVLNKLLERCKRKGYLYKNSNNYYIKTRYNSEKFNEKKNSIKKSIDMVICTLSQYLVEHSNIRKITDDNVKEYFISFLEHYGMAVCNNVIELKKLTNQDYMNYHIARFILNEHELSSLVFDNILEIVKGFFVYKSIYYFNTDKKKDLISKLKNTQVFFDTRLLINALGYNTEEDRKATIELIQLIRDSGGEVKAFLHVKDEVAGILTKYAFDANSHATMKLAYLDVNRYKKEDVFRLRDSLEINLEKIHIKLVDTPSHDYKDNENAEERGFIDIVKLKSLFEVNFNCNNLNRIDNDVSSIEAISLLRGNKKSASIENCKAIFVTQNNVIIQTVNEMFSERFNKGEIGFAIHEIDLTALLWLRNFNKCSNMPYFKLIENAYAACAPSDELLSLFLRKVGMMEKEGVITDQEAVIMRSTRSIQNDLVEVTENDSKNLSNEAIILVKERYINSITKDKDEIIKKQEEKINTYELNKQKAYDNVKIIAENASNKYCKKVSFFINVLLIVLFITCLLVVVISSFMGMLLTPINILFALVLALLAVISVIDTFWGRKKLIKNIIAKIRNKKFNEVYRTEIDRLNDIYIYYDMP